jgi:PAS domain S-box-containing protein
MEVEKIIEIAPVIYAHLDLWGNVLYINNFISAVTDYSKEEMVGKNFWQILYPQELKWQIDLIYEQFNNGRDINNYETECRCKDGRKKILTLTTYNEWEDSKPKSIHLFAQDITEHKNVLSQLRETFAEFEELVEESGSIILKMDPQGNVTFFNKYAEQLFGYKKEEIIGKNVVGTIVPEKESTGRNLRELILNIGKDPERYARNINENITRDGRRLWVSWTNRPIYDQNGNLKEILCIGNDITPYYETKQLYEVLTTHSLAGIYMFQDNKFVYVNPSLAKIFGYDSPDEILNSQLGPLDLTHPEDRNLAQEMIRRRIEEGQPYARYRFRGIRKDGQIIWLEALGSRIEYRGEPAILGTLIDVTQEVMAREEITRTKDELEKIFNSFSEPLMLIDSDFRIKKINQAGEKLLDLSHDEIIGKHCYQIIHGKNSPPSFCPHNKALSDGKPHCAEVYEGRLDRYIFMSISPILDTEGNVVESVHFIHDITRQKEMEISLRESEEMFKVLSEQSLVGIYLLDEQQIIYVNPTLAELLGYTQQEIYSCNVMDFIYPEDRELVAENIRKKLSGEIDFIRYRCRAVRKDGKVMWVETYGRRINYKGRPAILGALRDITQELEAENRIKELLQFRNNIIENANVWIDVMDENRKVLIWNKAAERISGYKKAEIIGKKKVWEKLYPDKNYRKKIINEMKEILEKEGVIENYETEITTKTGEKRILLWHIQNLYNPQGEKTGSVALGVEVTELRRKQEEIFYLQKLTFEILDDVPFGVYSINKDGVIDFFNKKMVEISGAKSKQDVLGLNVFEMPTYQKVGLTEYFRRGLNGESFFIPEIECTSYTGGKTTIRQYSGIPVKNVKGEVERLLLVVADLTETKKLQKELESERQFLHKIYDTIKGIVVVLDSNGKIIFVNRFIEEISEYTREEIIGKDWFEIFIPKRIKGKLKDYFKEIISQNIEPPRLVYENPIVTKSGEERLILWSNSIIPENGKVKYVLSIGQDITELKHLEQMLLEREKLAVIGEIASGVAHEIKNPLSIILQGINYLESKKFLEKSFTLPREVKTLDVMEKMKKAVQRAVFLLNELLDLSRAGEMRYEKFKFREIIDDAISMLEYRIKQKKAKIRVDCPQDLKMFGDKNWLSQVVINLINNSLDAVPEYKGRISISVEKYENLIVLVVKDNGKGIKSEDLGKVFQPYFTTKKKKGLGLGLAICRKVVEAHNGKIYISSEYGKGTEVRIVIPEGKPQEVKSDKSAVNR